MCSIFTVFTNKSFCTKFIQDSKNLLAISKARGPDESGDLLLKNSIYLGSNRLRIIGEPEIGKMPFSSSCRNYFIVFNGEIYNHKELRSELELLGQVFKTNTDTEVLLYSYIYWKDDFISKLNGIFAFTIYDLKKNIIIAARDRFGCKPLYFVESNDFVALSSDFNVLDKISTTDAGAIDFQALTSIMICRFVPGRKTIYKSIFKILPGEIISWNINDLSKSTKIFWSPKVNIQKFDQKIFEQKVTKAISLTALSDVDVNVLLSGGLDSSIVTSVLSKQNIKAFSCYFKKSEKNLDISKKSLLTVGNINETDNAKCVAEKYNIDYEDFELDYEINKDEFCQLQDALGEPIAVTNSLGLFLFSKKLKGRMRLALSGTGADELLGGYRDLYILRDDENNSILTTQELLSSFSDFDKGEVKALDFLNKNIINKSYIDSFAENSLKQFRNENLKDELLNQLMVFEINFALPNWEMDMADKLFMFSSIELRPSFLENEFVDYCLSIPSTEKNNKKPLRKMFENELPRNIVNRIKVPSLSTPEVVKNQSWFKEIEMLIIKDSFGIWSDEVKLNFEKYKNKASFDVFYRVIYLQAWLSNRRNLERTKIV